MNKNFGTGTISTPKKHDRLGSLGSRYKIERKFLPKECFSRIQYSHQQNTNRKAIVYVRQSTMNQVIHHQESQAAQYALRDQAIALKWRDSTIKTIDTDLGRSAATTDGREGFQTLVTGESEKVSGTNGAVGWT